MPMTEMERAVIESVKKRYGSLLDVEGEPGVLLEILRLYKDDILRTHAAPEEYVQVQMGAVGGVALAESLSGHGDSGNEAGQQNLDAVAGEITNGELMRELQRIRRTLDSLLAR